MVSAISWDDILSDLSYNSPIRIWVDELPEMISPSTKRTTVILCFIVLVQSLTIFYSLIPCVTILFGSKVPWRSTNMKDIRGHQDQQERDEKDHKMVSRLPRFIDLFSKSKSKYHCRQNRGTTSRQLYNANK